MADQQVQLLDLRGRTAEGFNLGESVSRSLRDGLPRKLPGEHPSDAEYAYTRSISTIALYSDEGLSIYEKITGLEVRFSRLVRRFQHKPSLRVTAKRVADKDVLSQGVLPFQGRVRHLGTLRR